MMLSESNIKFIIDNPNNEPTLEYYVQEIQDVIDRFASVSNSEQRIELNVRVDYLNNFYTKDISCPHTVAYMIYKVCDALKSIRSSFKDHILILPTDFVIYLIKIYEIKYGKIEREKMEGYLHDIFFQYWLTL